MRAKPARTSVRDPEVSPLHQYDAYASIPYTTLIAPAASNSRAQPTTTNKQTLYLKNTSSWTYCGPLLSSALPPSFHTWSSFTLSAPSSLTDRLLPLLSFLRIFLSAAGAQHYWLTIRATKPTHDYDIPRWHVDEDFFANSSLLLRDPYNPEAQKREKRKSSWKLCTTLLGPPTLFLHNNNSALHMLRNAKTSEKRKMGEHTCTSIRCLGCSTYADTVRSSLATSLSSHTTVSPAPNEIAFFRLGDDKGAVHSEPKCDEDRIFVNVVPGEEGELRDLMGRWGMEFPRAWSFGVPVGSDGFQERGSGNEVEDRPAMHVNVAGNYGKWLKIEGFEVNKVFGHDEVDATHCHIGKI